MDSPKTKQFIEILNNLKISDKKTLFLLPDYNNNVYLSARNLPNTQVLKAADVNTYSILNANNIIFVDNSIDQLKETFN